MLKLYKYEKDFGRMGSIEGLFITTQDKVDFFFNVFDGYVYLGEVLGKHTEVDFNLKPSDLEIISEDNEKLEWLAKITSSSVAGYNPLSYCTTMTEFSMEYDFEELFTVYVALLKELDSRQLSIEDREKYIKNIHEEFLYLHKEINEKTDVKDLIDQFIN